VENLGERILELLGPGQALPTEQILPLHEGSTESGPGGLQRRRRGPAVLRPVKYASTSGSSTKNRWAQRVVALLV